MDTVCVTPKKLAAYMKDRGPNGSTSRETLELFVTKQSLPGFLFLLQGRRRGFLVKQGF
jgi:hypothetical protein